MEKAGGASGRRMATICIKFENYIHSIHILSRRPPSHLPTETALLSFSKCSTASFPRKRKGLPFMTLCPIPEHLIIYEKACSLKGLNHLPFLLMELGSWVGG